MTPEEHKARHDQLHRALAALGAFRDSVFNLAAAIAYLENRR